LAYRLGVSAEFSAAHFLRGYQGSCEAVHGHNYRVEVVAEARELDGVGLGLDFRALKKELHAVIDPLDHRLLNDLPAFRENNPSSELIARHIFEQLAPRLEGGPARLEEVKLWETADAWASCRGV
jgi:6-pyruvoyltetrahydropterin/6-carboxytetrahydropterin synthase